MAASDSTNTPPKTSDAVPMVSAHEQTPSAAPTASVVEAGRAQKAAKAARKALGNLKVTGVWNPAKEIANDLLSDDSRTRKMARYFFVSIAGILVVLVVSVIHFRNAYLRLSTVTDTGEQGKNLGEFIKKQSDEAKRKFSVQSLGVFSIELKSGDGKAEPKAPAGVMNLAELSVVVECDETETCSFIEDNMPQVRNQLTDIFVSQNREELMSREGKRRLKSRIIQKLNLWLPKGKIENLYFDKLVIS